MNYYSYLNDRSFLRLLDEAPHREQYIRIFVLNFHTEEVLASIEGKSTGGSINVSGTSTLRRTGSVSVAVDPSGISWTGPAQYGNILEVENLLSINKKIRIETGFYNNLENLYGTINDTRNFYSEYEILWLPLGTYIIKNASVSENNSGINISLTINDKSAQLNGTVGGVIPAGTIFSEIETLSLDGFSRTTEHPLIKDIIRSLVVEFGGEDPSNVIIEDVPDVARKLLKWNGDVSVYLVKENQKKLLTTDNTVIDEDYELQEDYDQYEPGALIGYEYSPFIYPGKLECNAGDTVATVLDKIKNALGNYEWFYDVHGRFHFQAIKNYLNTSPTADIMNYTAADYLSVANISAPVYSFTDRRLLSSISVNPQYDNIKNDFLVWGSTKTVTGAEKPIRYRATFDSKPTVRTTAKPAVVYKDYRNLWAVLVGDKIKEVTTTTAMTDKKIVYVMSSTKQVYIYYPEHKSFGTTNKYIYCSLLPSDWRSELYFQSLENQSTSTFNEKPYMAELISEFPKLYDVMGAKTGSSFRVNDSTKIVSYYTQLKTATTLSTATTSNPWEEQNVDEDGALQLTKKSGGTAFTYVDTVLYNGKFYDKWESSDSYEYTSQVVNFTATGEYKPLSSDSYEYWIDYIETDSSSAPVSQFSVSSIGRRTKVVNEKDVNILFNVNVPDFCFIEADGDVDNERALVEGTGYEVIQVSPSVWQHITVGTSRNSAYDKIKELIQNHTQYNEQIALTTVPIYYLEPNTRIEVFHDEMGINGEYLIKSISLPLVPSGTSNISATKCLQKTI